VVFLGEEWNQRTRSLSLALCAYIFSKDADLLRNNCSLSVSIFFSLGETIAEAGKEALNRNNTIEKIRERERDQTRKNIEEEKDFAYS
jgi:hypothetical protein